MTPPELANRPAAAAMPSRGRQSRRATVGAIVALDLRRLARDRLALFFVLVLPFVLIVTIGSFVNEASGDASVAVIDDDGGAVAERLMGELDGADGLAVDTTRNRREAERDIRIGQLEAAVVIPEGFSARVDQGDARVSVMTDPMSQTAPLVDAALNEAVDRIGRQLTVQHVLQSNGVADAEASAATATERAGRSEVDVQTLGSESESPGFAFAAGGQMILFMFVNALTAGGMFIEMRRLGILNRVRAGPVDPSDVLIGLGVSRFLVATGLAALILLFASAAYGVDWGDPVVVGSTVVLFGFVSAGASILIGSLFDQPDASVSVGIPVGLGMAALGGCMFPLFLAPEPMQVAAKVLTPHAWAVEALMDSSLEGAGLADLWSHLAVLALWATVLVAVARWMTRRFSR